MTAARQDIELIAGESQTVTITVTNAGSAFDLDDATISWRVADSPGGAATLTKTEGSGITVTNGDAGILQIAIDAGDLATPGLYWHALKVVNAGVTYIAAKGRCVVRAAPA